MLARPRRHEDLAALFARSIHAVAVCCEGACLAQARGDTAVAREWLRRAEEHLCAANDLDADAADALDRAALAVTEAEAAVDGTARKSPPSCTLRR
jgi:hypothetical protein